MNKKLWTRKILIIKKNNKFSEWENIFSLITKWFVDIEVSESGGTTEDTPPSSPATPERDCSLFSEPSALLS